MKKKPLWDVTLAELGQVFEKLKIGTDEIYLQEFKDWLSNQPRPRFTTKRQFRAWLVEKAKEYWRLFR